MNKSEYIYNSGEIVFRNNEWFWIFPVEHINSPKYFVYSPWFSCKGEKWRLIKLPDSNNLSENHSISFRLWRKVQSCLIDSNYTLHLSLKTIDDNRVIKSCTGDIDSDYGCELKLCCYREIHFESFFQNGLVKLFFNIKEKKTIRIIVGFREKNNRDEEIEDEESSDDEMNCDDEDSSDDEENTEDSYKDEESSESDKNSEDEESYLYEKKKKKHVASESKGIKILAQNIKQVFLDSQMSDAVLKVDNREFNVHKVIMAARSPVFASMFQHDLTEKNTNIVNIPDCTAESFEAFLLYLYSGSADTLSTNNVYNLYYAADKYRVDDLKEVCVKFMKNNLSQETFCDIISLSLRHGESHLLKVATRFFCKNAREIVKTVQWQSFMSENSTQANELIIKALNA